jgi:glycosyltransferase involved in cell wall biosynthesis/GT2 family glycosyltransferase
MTGLSASIVICTLNRASQLRNALQSLHHLDYQNFEVIVVNGPSTDETDEVLHRWGTGVKVLRDPALGLATSRNIGIAAAAGDITAFIDDDAVPHPRWLKSIANWYHDERVAGVGGYTMDETGVRFQMRKTVCDRFGSAYGLPDWFDERALCVPGTPYYPSLLGTNATFRTSVLRQVGGWDPIFAAYLDETDVCLRIIDLGYRLVYEPSAIIYHQAAASDRRDDRRIDRTLYPQAVSKAYFIMRHGTRFGLARAGEAFKKFETEVRGSQKWLAEQNEITNEHRYSLEQDFLWGIRQGIELASKPVLEAPEDRVRPATPPIFEPFEKSNEALRICFISKDFPPTNDAGIANWTRRLAATLGERGHRVHVVTRSTTEHESIRFDNGIWVHTCCPADEATFALAERYHIPPSTSEWCARAHREVQLIKDFGLDVVSFPIAELEGIACLDDPKLAINVSLHTTYGLGARYRPDWAARPIYKALHVDKMIAAERDCLIRAPCLLANSSAVIRDIESYYGLDLGERCTVVPHSTDDLLNPEAGSLQSGGSLPPPSKSRLPFPNKDRLAVLYVGRFEARKGTDIALDAAQLVIGAEPNVEFWFVGDELNEASALLVPGIASHPALTDPRVQVLGKLSREALAECYRLCDLVLMPSRYESFGLVVIEGMAAGKPVIALNVGGPSEVVVDRLNGVLLPLEDMVAARIAEVILGLHRDRATLQSLAKGARATFEERYTAAREAAAVENLFRKAIAQMRT